MFDEQINRIRQKLAEAKNTDKKFQVFGASGHKYVVYKPATLQDITGFEKQYSVRLPECYTAFLTQIGNGGAAPFYGIYPLGKGLDEVTDSPAYLQNECILYPKMTDAYWAELNKKLERKDISDEEYEKELSKIFGGILPIGTQGCCYIHGLVLNGKYKGRVVNCDLERQKPQFTFEANLLDWYERWLDEIISGDLLEAKYEWFGYTMGGSVEELLQKYFSATDEETKLDCLAGFSGKRKIEPSVLDILEKEYQNSSDKIEKRLLNMLVRYDYARAKPYLLNYVRKDLLTVFQYVHWYGKKESKEWQPVIEENIHRIKDGETFRFCTYLLEDTKTDYSRLIIPFTKNENSEIRKQAFYALGNLENKANHIDIFINGLCDKENKVIHTTLQALSGVNDNRLLPYYKRLAERFTEEQDYILVNLNHRLKPFGLDNKSIQKIDVNM